MTPLNETTASNRHCSRLYKSLTPATNTDDGGFRPMKDFVCSPESGSMAGDQRASVGSNPIRDSDYAQEGPSRSGGTTKAECNYPPGTSPADRPVIGVSDALIAPIPIPDDNKDDIDSDGDYGEEAAGRAGQEALQETPEPELKSKQRKLHGTQQELQTQHALQTPQDELYLGDDRGRSISHEWPKGRKRRLIEGCPGISRHWVAEDPPEEAEPSSPSHSRRHKRTLKLPGTIFNDEEQRSPIPQHLLGLIVTASILKQL
ncbi:hypothetical protein MMC31_002121 [Peltigera leucophlebia]|nr:hypothetical protein [Peltigera leucophlebia]